MMNVNCRRCGVVNLVADEVCKVCGADLQPAPTYRKPPTPPEPEYQTNRLIQPFDGPGALISSTLSLWKNNFWLIAKIAFVIVAPFEMFRVLSEQRMEQDPQLMLGVLTLQIFSNVLIVPALFYALMKVMETGVAPGVNEAYRWGLSKIPKLALASVLAWVLCALGSLLCIIPGIFLMMAFYVVYPVAVFENTSATDALRRSYKLTEGRRWNILAASIVVALIVMLAALPATLVSAAFTLNDLAFWPLKVVALIFADIVAEAGTVLTLVVYLSILRALE
jgi:hypothetical protein